MHCPACAAEIPEDDLFCEACGHDLRAAQPASTQPAGEPCICGAAASEADEDGFCLRCGRKSRALSAGQAAERAAADHVELALSPRFAAVTDRGLRHDHNEDRFGIAQIGDICALVVCDGVSTTRESEVASSSVAEAVLESLTVALDPSSGNPVDPEQALRNAIAAGAERLRLRTPIADHGNPPSTTVVAALVNAGQATIAWLGDSRAYWFDATTAHPLTTDHSWLNEVVASGEMTAAAAEQAPNAHAITRWIGADANPDQAAPQESEPELVRLALAAPGLFMLCTDGLWNYAPDPGVLHKVVEEAGAANADDALLIARRLVEFANRQGGRDNITVALLRVTEPVASAPPAAAEHTP
jgi:serine/threonine protein phosphatase PrpC